MYKYIMSMQSYILGLRGGKSVLEGTAIIAAIRNGTPLPKGHGRLIDADRLKRVFNLNTGYDYHDLIDIAPTIIESESEE